MTEAQEDNTAIRSERGPVFDPFHAENFRRYVTDTGKILPRRITKFSPKQQRELTRTIKKSRFLLLTK